VIGAPAARKPFLVSLVIYVRIKAGSGHLFGFLSAISLPKKKYDSDSDILSEFVPSGENSQLLTFTF
jgi:hypothetical protein